MDAKGTTQRVARQRIRQVGWSGDPLTPGKFACTIGIQPTLRGKSFWPIRRSYARIT